MSLLEDVQKIIGERVAIERWADPRRRAWFASVCGKTFKSYSPTSHARDLDDKMTVFLRGIVSRDRIRPKLRSARSKRHSRALPLCRGV